MTTMFGTEMSTILEFDRRGEARWVHLGAIPKKIRIEDESGNRVPILVAGRTCWGQADYVVTPEDHAITVRCTSLVAGFLTLYAADWSLVHRAVTP